MTPTAPLTLRRVVGLLEAHYGPPAGPPTRDPFELILWENVAYLAPPARRREAFEALRREVGTRPDEILAAGAAALEAVCAHGIMKGTSAAKLRDCAHVALAEFGGDLGAAFGRKGADVKRGLRRFPGIGEPGADKIMLMNGLGSPPRLAPESNGLRVLARVGLIRDDGNYARTYRRGCEAAEPLSREPAALRTAHLLLQQHGQSCCRRAAPHCARCPLARGCAFATTGAGQR